MSTSGECIKQNQHLPGNFIDATLRAHEVGRKKRVESIYEYKKTSWTKSCNPSVENLSMIGFHVLSIKHAVLVHLELGFVAIGISCYFHEPTNLQEAPTMMARGDMKSCCLELEASQSHITDLAASYSSMVRIFLSSEHAMSHDLMKKVAIATIAAMGLGWIIHQIHGSQCFSSSSGQNLSLDVLCFKHKDYSLKIMVQKISTKKYTIIQKTQTPEWIQKGVEEVQFWMRVMCSKLMLQWVQHQGTSRASLRRAPDARRDPPVQDVRKYHGLLPPLALTKGTWFYVLFLNDGF